MAQVRPLCPTQCFEVLREWLLYNDEYAASLEHAAEVNRVAVQAELAYLHHHEEDHTEDSLQDKLDRFDFVIFLRDEAEAVAVETRKKMLALQDLDAKKPEGGDRPFTCILAMPL